MGSHKRSHDLLSISNGPPSKRTKPGNDEDGIISSILLGKGESVNNEATSLQLSENDISQAEVKQPVNLSPIIAKLKQLCNNTATLDDKQIILLWEELASVQIDQVYNVLYVYSCFHFQKVNRCLYMYA